ncbi:MAG: Acetylornithine aminotransferase [Clostridiales bacterium 38_11]|nr:MAG: Acetylornithine aminotransferase [Clostridiales bacterium 38_11]
MELMEQDSKYIMNTYSRIPLEIRSGDGVFLTDMAGNEYLDMFSGIAVNCFGHNNRKILEEVINQSQKYIHLSNYFTSEPAVSLAKLLVENTFADKVFFTNSGTESNEAAIKIARKYGRGKSITKTRILSANNSFHGRTCGGLSITGQLKYRESFEPLIPDVSFFDFNDIEGFNNLVDDDICAVFIEIIQGEGGVVEIDKDFLDTIKSMSLKHDFLLVVDEIQSGVGRTGMMFAYEHYGIVPDLVTVAKALGGGFPIGAVLAGDRCSKVLVPGDHGTTFGANPVACAVGCVVLKEVIDEVFLSEVVDKGNYIKTRLSDMQTKHPGIIRQIRGQGLMLGIDVGEHAAVIKDKAFENKLLLNVTAGSIIRIVPALNITYDEISLFISKFKDILDSLQ